MFFKSSILPLVGLGLLLIAAQTHLAQARTDYTKYGKPARESGAYRVNLKKKSYYFGTLAETYDEAEWECLQEGGNLAVINSNAEEKFLAKMFLKFYKEIVKTTGKSMAHSMAWVGISRKTSGASWKTVLGNKPNYLNWATTISSKGDHIDQPDNKYGLENCAALAFRNTLKNGLADAQCNRRLAFICEIYH